MRQKSIGYPSEEESVVGVGVAKRGIVNSTRGYSLLFALVFDPGPDMLCKVSYEVFSRTILTRAVVQHIDIIVIPRTK